MLDPSVFQNSTRRETFHFTMTEAQFLSAMIGNDNLSEGYMVTGVDVQPAKAAPNRMLSPRTVTVRLLSPPKSVPEPSPVSLAAQEDAILAVADELGLTLEHRVKLWRALHGETEVDETL
jgi:hypothetical protein